MPDMEMWWFGELKEVDRGLSALSKAGLGPGTLPYESLWKTRGKIFGQHGYRKPRIATLLRRLPGFSPGIIKVWHDGETGFMSEARVRPGAPPVYKNVSDEIAIAILKDEVTPELEAELLTPDEYLGE